MHRYVLYLRNVTKMGYNYSNIKTVLDHGSNVAQLLHNNSNNTFPSEMLVTIAT